MAYTLPGIFVQTADKTITNTAAETSSIGTGTGSLSLPAGFWYPGRAIKVFGGGPYTTPLSSNITTKVKLGSAIIAQSNTNALLNAQTNMRWNFEIVIICRTVNATTGSFRVSGRLLFDIGQASPACQFIGTNITTPETCDNTIASLLDITNTWDTASTTRSVTTSVAVFEILS